ncbi:Vacuolar protein sorting-associated protein [Plasmodiophora brassicae]
MATTTDPVSGVIDHPLLCYQRAGDIVHGLLSNDIAVAIAACDRFLVVGTQSGAAHIVSPAGALIRSTSQLHSAPVTSIAIDDAMQEIAVASSNGTIAILDTTHPDRPASRLRYPTRVTALAYRPSHTTLVRSLTIGDAAGNLVLHSASMFANKDVTLHKGEGAITAIAWSGSFLAWGNQCGFKVFDLCDNTRLAFIQQNAPADVACQPSLAWHAPDTLVTAWHNVIHVLQVREGVGTLLGRFVVDFIIAGCVPFTIDNDEDRDLLALLAVFCDGRCEIRIVDTGNQVRSADALSLPSARALAASAGQLYVLDAGDVIVGRRCDEDDHVTYLLDQGRLGDAVDLAVSLGQAALRRHDVEELAVLYLTTLLNAGAYDNVLQQSARLLGGSIPVWERWIRFVASVNLVRVIVDGIPAGLDRDVYDLVLVQLCSTDHDKLLHLLQTWPADRYNASVVLDACPASLKQCRAILLERVGRHGDAIRLRLDLGDPSVFDLIGAHPDEVADLDLHALTRLDLSKAVSRLIASHVPPDVVVAQLEQDRLALHRYLHALFEFDRDAGARYHERQLSLYAEFQPDALLTFLAQSSHYKLEDALAVCQVRGLHRAQLYLLKRMGNNAAALTLLLNALDDVEGAVAFVEEMRSRRLRDQLLQHLLQNSTWVGRALIALRPGFIDPVKFIRAIPGDMQVDDIKRKFMALVAEYKVEVSIGEVANQAIKEDCVALLRDVRRLQSTAIVVDPSAPARCAECSCAIGYRASDIVVSCAAEIRHGQCSSRRAPNPKSDING